MRIIVNSSNTSQNNTSNNNDNNNVNNSIMVSNVGSSTGNTFPTNVMRETGYTLSSTIPPPASSTYPITENQIFTANNNNENVPENLEESKRKKKKGNSNSSSNIPIVTTTTTTTTSNHANTNNTNARITTTTSILIKPTDKYSNPNTNHQELVQNQTQLTPEQIQKLIELHKLQFTNFEQALKKEKGFVIKKMGEDGNCLFRAIGKLKEEILVQNAAFF